MRTFASILLAVVAGTSVSVQALQYSVKVARRHIVADSAVAAEETCETALGFQRSLHISHGNARRAEALDIHLGTKFEDASVFGLQRSTQIKRRAVNTTTSIGYLDVKSACPLGLQRSVEITRRGSESSSFTLDGLSTIGLQRSMQVLRFGSVA